MAVFRQIKPRLSPVHLCSLAILVPLLFAPAVTVMFATSSWADFNRGIAAYAQNDYLSALQEWKSGAKNGEPKSQQALGFMFLAGSGVSKDIAKAHFWFEIAAESFSPGPNRGRATRLRDLTAARLSTDQHKKAHRLALEWLDEHKTKRTNSRKSDRVP